MNMHIHAEEFLRYLSLNRRMSMHTISAYRSDLEQFEAFCKTLEFNLLEGTESRTVRSWMAHLMETKISPRSIHRKVSTLRSFSKYLRKNGIINKDPLSKISTPKTPKRIVQDIPAADLQNLFAHFPWDETEFGMRDRLLLLLFYSTGMRLSELIGLKCIDIDLDRMNISVTGKRNKQRVIPIHPEAAEELRPFIFGRNGYLFCLENGKPLYPVFVYRLVNKYLRLFSDALKTSPHVLRHSFATHMLNNGAELLAIKEILGHANLAATQVYTKNSFEKLKKIHALHPRD
jgi:integrase/recombinase XerC